MSGGGVRAAASLGLIRAHSASLPVARSECFSGVVQPCSNATPPRGLACSEAAIESVTVLTVKPKPTGNWTPDGKAERAALRRDYLELTPAQRMKQVFELSRFMSRVSEAGHRQRGA